MKTNATRLLERLGIAHELREYDVDPEDLSAIKVAAQIGMPAGQVFKTLCARSNDGSVVLAVVPGDAELDLKALARLARCRRVELVPVAQLQQLTGYIRGGVTSLACKKPYPVYLDDSALRHPAVAISAGVRGTQVVLAPQDLLRATSAEVGVLIAKPRTDEEDARSV